MASDKGIPEEAFDERLAKARDGLLSPGEKVIAQAEADQGQGLILTDSRVMVIKVGITATGTSGGCITGVFPYDEISAVNVRKGPLGAVIQVCSSASAPAAGGLPDNVVTFTGSQRMRRCDAIAAEIEIALGKPLTKFDATQDQPPHEAQVESAPAKETDTPKMAAEAAETEPAPPKRRGGRQARSLADEMFAEMTGQEPPAPNVSTPPPAAAKDPVPEPVAESVTTSTPEPAPAPEVEARPLELVEVVEESVPVAAEAAGVPDPAPVEAVVDPEPLPEPEPEPAKEPAEVFTPNPNLPKPRVRHRAPAKALILIGGLMAAVLVGVAVTEPLRAPVKAPVQVSTADDGAKVSIMRKQWIAVQDYSRATTAAIGDADAAIARVESAVRSGNAQAVGAAVRTTSVSAAWRRVGSIAAPPGLAGAKSNLESGLFICKNAIANISGELRSSGSVGRKDGLVRLGEGRNMIAKGQASIARRGKDLQGQIAELETAQKTKPGSPKM